MTYKAYLARTGKPIREVEGIYLWDDYEENLDGTTQKFVKKYTVDGGYMQLDN
jgi:hypothetical protein